MNCDICARPHHPQRRPFLCAVDVRNALYEKRVAHATALLQNEQLDQQVTSLLEHTNTTTAASSTSIRLGEWASEQQRAVTKTNDIIAQADKLRQEIEAARQHLQQRKEDVTRRKSDLATAANGLQARRARTLEDVEKSISRNKFKWNAQHEDMASTRAFLCLGAARLWGLNRMRKGGAVRYEIGGIDIPNLSQLGPASPELISASFAHVTHILMLATRYLGIRLPAEITLPHRDYPRPTVFSLASSYQSNDVSFPGLAAAASHGDANAPRAPRPRPLFVDKPLPVLAKEEPATHAMFIEGAALLAYDIAWLCCSQGIPIGNKNSDDIFDIGRNMYTLLIGNQVMNANTTGPQPSSGQTSPGGSSEHEAPDSARFAPKMGQYSHATAHTFLDDEFARTFKLPNPKFLADRLRNKLSSDGPLPDWEVLEDEAWAADEHLEAGVLSRGDGKTEPVQRSFGVESMVTVRSTPQGSAGRSEELTPSTSTAGKSRSSGTNGWTKVKNR